MNLHFTLPVIRILFTLAFIAAFNLSGFGQDMNLETLKKQLHELHIRNRDILGKYDSLIIRQKQLKTYLENELDIYQACETAYMDKIHFLEQGGDSHQKKLMDQFNLLQLEYDGLESKIILNIRDFNYWNDIKAFEVKEMYEEYVVPEMQRIQINHNELLDYVKKIEEMQNEASTNLISYDSCRLTCLVNCNCGSYMEKYQQTINLAENYMLHYSKLLNEQESLYASKDGQYNEYKRSYDEYFNEYQQRQEKLEIDNLAIKEEQNKISRMLKELNDNVHTMILKEMEKDLKSFYRKEYNNLYSLEQVISKGIGNPQLYYDLQEIQRTSEIMINTLNPELDVDKVVAKINGYDNLDPVKDSDYNKIRYISVQYAEILQNVKSLIVGYDTIPYFCMKAYPHYSGPIVDENLRIVDNRMNFKNENLETRTNKFLNISELDLSNSNFSMDVLFQGHRNIQKLDLSNTKISSVKNLKGSNIKWLDLSNTFVTEDDLNYISTMENLEYLDLSNTQLNRKDIYDLCYYLKLKRRNCVAR